MRESSPGASFLLYSVVGTMREDGERKRAFRRRLRKDASKCEQDDAKIEGQETRR